MESCCDDFGGGTWLGRRCGRFEVIVDDGEASQSKFVYSGKSELTSGAVSRSLLLESVPPVIYEFYGDLLCGSWIVYDVSTFLVVSR